MPAGWSATTLTVSAPTFTPTTDMASPPLHCRSGWITPLSLTRKPHDRAECSPVWSLEHDRRIWRGSLPKSDRDPKCRSHGRRKDQGRASLPAHRVPDAGANKKTTSRQRAKSTAGTGRIGYGGATHQTANLCSKLNCASLPRPQGRAGAPLFQQPDLENHWVPMRNRALPSVMAFVAQATQPADALLRDRQAGEIPGNNLIL